MFQRLISVPTMDEVAETHLTLLKEAAADGIGLNTSSGAVMWWASGSHHRGGASRRGTHFSAGSITPKTRSPRSSGSWDFLWHVASP